MDRKTEYSRKRDRVLKFLAAGKYTAAVLTSRAGFSWYTAGASSYVNAGAEGGTVSIVVTPGGDVAVTNNIEAPRQSAEEIGELGMELVTVPWHDGAAFAAAVRKAAGARPVADMPCGIQAADGAGALAALRFGLLPAEIERYRRLGNAVSQALGATCRIMRPGHSEHMVAGDLAGCLRALGILPWVVLVAADERIELFRHPLPTSRKIKSRCMVVVCAELNGLIVSATRLVNFLPLSADLAARHRACVEVDARMIHATRPGARLAEVLAVAQKAYAAAGFEGEWQHHHQGGPTGYGPRDLIATPGCGAEVLPDQAFAWNPSIRGTKSEDTILVGPEANEILSPATHWPMIEVEIDGRTYARPDILVREA
jgi:Xaa-Pro dipeptidase